MQGLGGVWWGVARAGGLATSAKQKISFDMISFLVFVPSKIAMTSTSALDSTPAGAAAVLKTKRGGVAHAVSKYNSNSSSGHAACQR